ncbi:MAG TPA: RHS repeat-associated core domain-containing protein, partial [Thermoanaerobaculia bacterium]
SDGCAASGRCFASLPSYVPIATNSNHHMALNYDDAGSVTSDGTYEFGYDATSMMISLTRDDDRDERYLYTADDERIAVVRIIGAGRRTTWSLRDLGKRLLRTWTDDTTSGTRQFTWSEDEIWRGGSLLASDSPTGLKRYHLDHLGSPRLVTNGIGLRIGEQFFDPFGTGGTLDGGRLQFTSHERDLPESGRGLVLDYMHARYYDGAGGRFLSVDPGRDWNPSQPQSWNMYAYVRNNPMRYTDPTGRYICVGGDAAACNTIEGGINKMRESAARLKDNDPKKKELLSVIAAFGKQGDANSKISKVWINPANPTGRGQLLRGNELERAGRDGNLFISLVNIKNKADRDGTDPFVVLGGTLTHGGKHMLQPTVVGLPVGAPPSMLSLIFSEIQAYNLQQKYYQGLGLGALAPDPIKGPINSALNACQEVECIP